MPKSTSSKPSSTRSRPRASAADSPAPRRPGAAQLQAARRKRIADVIAPGLDILFVGINPGLYSAALGQHFARPGNRFWPALHRAGLTPRQLAPQEQRQLLKSGIGITNIVHRTTAAASELSAGEIARGGKQLLAKLRRYRPRMVVVLGIGAFRTAFNNKNIRIGRQPQPLAGTELWVLPNPSGLNAHYQLNDFVRLFRGLRRRLRAD